MFAAETRNWRRQAVPGRTKIRQASFLERGGLEKRGDIEKMQRGFVLWVLVALAVLAQADSDLPVYTPNLQVDVQHADRGSALSADSVSGAAGTAGEEKESCGCEDDFPPGAGFAFRREGYAIVNLKGDKVVRQRKFFENERITFKEMLSPGDGRTFPQVSKGEWWRRRLRDAEEMNRKTIVGCLERSGSAAWCAPVTRCAGRWGSEQCCGTQSSHQTNACRTRAENTRATSAEMT